MTPLLLAAALASTAVADETESALLHERAHAALREERPADARVLAREALGLPDAHWTTVFVYLSACEADGLFEVCLSAVQGLALADPEVDALYQWARVERGLAPADVLGEIEEPGKHLATLALAGAALDDGSPEVTVAMVGTSDEPEAQHMVLSALVDQGLYKEAGARTKQIIGEYPDRPDLLSPLWQRRDDKAAAKWQKKALKHAEGRLVSIDPVVGYRVLTMALSAGNDPLAEAASDRLKALGETRPLDRVPYNDAMRGDMARGLARLRNPQLPELTPDEREDVAMATAAALRDMGRVDEALELYQRTREQRDSARLAIDHANQLLRMGRLRDAKQIAREAVHLAARSQPGDPGRLRADRDEQLALAWATLAFVLAGREEVLEALAAITTANALSPQGDWFYLQAGLQQQVGDDDAAFVSYAIADALGVRGADMSAASAYQGIGASEDAMFAVVQHWSARRGDNSISVALETKVEQEARDRFERPAVGRELRDFSIETEDGPLSRTDLEGQVVVLNFWASWCGPCQAELPAYAKVARRLQKKGLPVTFVAVSVDSRERDYRRWKPDGDVDGLRIGWSRQMGQEWRVTALPTTWVAGPDGVLRSMHTGFQPGVEDDLEKEILELLPEDKGR